MPDTIIRNGHRFDVCPVNRWACFEDVEPETVLAVRHIWPDGVAVPVTVRDLGHLMRYIALAAI